MTAFHTQGSTLARRGTVALAAAVIAVTPACGGRDRRTPDDTLVVLVDSRLNSLDPRYSESNYDTKLSRLVAPGLTSVEQASLEPKLLLAESIAEIDPRTHDVVLRPGLRFSDGSPLTARDVVFTYTSVLDPAMKSPFLRGFVERFERVEALSDRRVRFHLVEPIATFLSDLEFGIVSQAATGEGGRFAGGRVIGAGPYAVESFHPENVALVRNQTWAFEAPPMERVRARVVLDSNARALMLVGGSADLTQNSIRIDLVGELAERPRVEVEGGPSALYTYLMMNNRDPLLADARVRRAIAHGIDRERVIQAKLGGRAVLATGLLPPEHWAYRGDVPRYQHDPARARALLDEAGYLDPDGPGGLPRMRLVYKTSSDPFRLALARVWASQLAEVGIAVEVQSFESKTVFADIKKGNFQLASMQTAPITEPDFLFTYYHSSRMPTPDDPNAHNRWRYRSARVDELTALGRRTMDRERRREIYGEVQEILARDLPVIPLWHEDNLAVRNVSVSGYGLYPSASLWGLLTTSKRR
jgi:peptide/nickel transport system substrate-binding protein